MAANIQANLSRLMDNLDFLRDLNCAGRVRQGVRDLKCPVSYSLRAVKMRPVETDPALATLTLRRSGQIRVVHGTGDIYQAIKGAVPACATTVVVEEQEEDGKETKKEAEEKEEKKEEEPKKEEEEGEKKIEKEDEGTPKEKKAEEVVEAKEEKGEVEAKEGKEKAQPRQDPQDDERDGLWKITLQPNAEEKPSEEDHLKILCRILQRLISAGWEVLTTGELTVTTGCELFTWILKKSTTPPADAEVAAVVLLPGDELKARVVAPDAAASTAASNVLRQAIAGVAPPDEEEKKKEGEEEAAKEEKRQSKVPADDPDCPAVFDLPAAFGSKEGSAGSALTSKLVLEVSRLLFCRQWKLVATAPLPLSRHEALLFCRDSRILPALGQESFAMVALQKPDRLRLHNVSEEAEKDIRGVIVDSWPAGLESKEAEEVAGGAKEYRLLENPWTRSRRPDGKGQMVAAQIMASKVLLALNKRELNLYARVCLRKGEPDQVTLLMFRQSNVAYTETLTLQPTGLNRLAVIGASEEDLEAIRKCLKSRWPYPTTRDGKVVEGGEQEAEVVEEKKVEPKAKEEEEEKKDGDEKEDKGKEDKEAEKAEEKEEEKDKKDGGEDKEEAKEEEEKKGENEVEEDKGATWWLFKVKRYPWAVSYGNKHVDKLMEAVKLAAARQEIRPVNIPEPNNMDAESAKSMLAFLLKDLGELGWRLQTSADVCSSKVSYPRVGLPERRSDADALFLLR